MLVGNDENEGVLEITLTGPQLLFQSDAVIALTGADLSPEVDGAVVPMWRSFFVKAGSCLRFGQVYNGCRGYIAFAGGVDVPKVMGSKSTYVRAETGGYNGRVLKKGDLIKIGTAEKPLPSLCGKFLLKQYIPEYSNEYTVRAVLGPQDDYFTKKGIHTFLGCEYRVSTVSDRMGCRLEGERIETVSGSDIISDGIVMGSVQIPGDGKPIILMADGQTTGGYAKIATVVSADLWKIAQSKPGDDLRFKQASLEEAREALIETESCIRGIKEQKVSGRRFFVKINGNEYDVTVDEIKQ